MPRQPKESDLPRPILPPQIDAARQALLDRLRQSPVSLSLAAVVVAVYLLHGPASDAARFDTFAQLLRGLFYHGNLPHLLVNLALLVWGGLLAEPRLGQTRIALLAGTAALVGTLAEHMIAGGGFIGLSGIAYGLASAGLLLSRTISERRTWIAVIAAGLMAEWVYLRGDLAVYTHAIGATTGIVFAMFSKLFGSKGAQLKPMKWDHVAMVVPIIAETDEDDAAEAEETFLSRGFDNMFVLIERGRVMGLTGFEIDPVVPDLAWLSWTYLAREHMGQGYGSQMFNDLLGMLNQHQIRKIFIETSDYAEDGISIYAGAHRLYEEFGAEVELTLPDYHAPGEAKIIYGLMNPEVTAEAMTPDNAAPGLAVTGIDKAAETDAVAGMRWEEIPTGLSGVDFAINSAQERDYRMAVLAIPSDISGTQGDALTAKGFRHIGSLADYYGPGLGQEWWTHDLASCQK